MIEKQKLEDRPLAVVREKKLLGWVIFHSPSLRSLHLLVLRRLLRLLLVPLGLLVLPLVPTDLPRERLHVQHEVDLVEVHHAEVLLCADRQLLGLLPGHARGRGDLAAFARVSEARTEAGNKDAARDNLKPEKNEMLKLEF